MILTRRHLLKSSLGLTLLVAGAGSSVRAVRSENEEVIEQIVTHYLGAENLHPAAARDFAADFAPHFKETDWRINCAVALGVHFAPSFRGFFSTPFAERVERFERRIMTEFLLSSTYNPATNRVAKSAEKIEYVAYEPRRGCNPFARQLETDDRGPATNIWNARHSISL